MSQKKLEYALPNRNQVSPAKKCKIVESCLELEGVGVTDLLTEASRECMKNWSEECVRGGVEKQKSVMMKAGVNGLPMNSVKPIHLYSLQNNNFSIESCDWGPPSPTPVRNTPTTTHQNNPRN